MQSFRLEPVTITLRALPLSVPHQTTLCAASVGNVLECLELTLRRLLSNTDPTLTDLLLSAVFCRPVDSNHFNVSTETLFHLTNRIALSLAESCVAASSTVPAVPPARGSAQLHHCTFCPPPCKCRHALPHHISGCFYPAALVTPVMLLFITV
jgi:hypothetical protein